MFGPERLCIMQRQRERERERGRRCPQTGKEEMDSTRCSHSTVLRDCSRLVSSCGHHQEKKKQHTHTQAKCTIREGARTWSVQVCGVVLNAHCYVGFCGRCNVLYIMRLCVRRHHRTASRPKTREGEVTRSRLSHGIRFEGS